MLFKFHFLVDEKHVTGLLITLAGKAHEMTCVPVLNAKTQGNGVKPIVQGNLPELALAEIRKQGLKQVNAKIMRDIVGYVGGSPSSYQHVLKECIKSGTMKKDNKGRKTSKMTYAIQPVK